MYVKTDFLQLLNSTRIRYFTVTYFFKNVVSFKRLENIGADCCLLLGENVTNLKLLSKYIPMVNLNTFEMANQARAENSFKRIFVRFSIDLTQSI